MKLIQNFTLSLLVLASVTSGETTVILDPTVAVAHAPAVIFLDLPLIFFFFFFVAPVSLPAEPVSVQRTRTNSIQNNDKIVLSIIVSVGGQIGALNYLQLHVHIAYMVPYGTLRGKGKALSKFGSNAYLYVSQ